jgi:hypothetical protein
MTTTSSNTALSPVCPNKPQKGNKEKDDDPYNQLALNISKYESFISSLIRIIMKLGVYLKPDWRKILVFIGFLIIYVGGSIQSWTFTDLETFGYSPPPFYEIVRLFPFWLVWLVTIAPLVLLASLIGSILIPFIGNGADFIFNRPVWISVVIYVIYYYCLSCLVISFKDYRKEVADGKKEPGKYYSYFFGRKKGQELQETS